MAIYNSIALGSAKGKIGNLVFYKLNTQNVVREWIVPPNNRLPNQQINRNRMRNCVHAYQWLQQFLAYTNALSSATTSAYNGWVKYTKELFPDEIYFTGAKAAALLAGSDSSFCNFFRVTLIHSGGIVEVHLDTPGHNFIDECSAIICTWDDVTEEYVQNIMPIGEEEWNAGIVQFPDMIGLLEFSAAYIFPNDQANISNIHFIQGNNG